MTTRSPRPGEKDGRDYIFITKEEFLKRRSRKEFLEWAEVFGEYYGTPEKKVWGYLNKGRDVLLSIDVQGAMKIKKLNLKAVFIFILPPNFEELKNRLKSRSTEGIEDLNLRLSVARREIEMAKKYDYTIINDRFNEALSKLRAIILSERRKALSKI